MRNNPLVAVDVHDVIGCQVLHIHEGQSRPTDKDKDVTDEGQIVVLELMGYDGLQFVLCQELPFLAVRADVELRKRVTGNLTIIVRSHHYTFQPHAALPDGSARKSSLRAEIGGKVLDKAGCKFFDERSD